ADSAPLPETGADLPSLRGNQRTIPRTLERCHALRSAIADPFKHGSVCGTYWNRADPRAAMEKDLHRRLRRSWWRLSGASVDRSAIVPSHRGLLDQYPGGPV